MARGGQSYYYYADRLGSIRFLTDISGIIVQTYQYDAFGNIVSESGSVENPYTLTNREYDSESGLFYYRARYYDSGIGRFISEDPIGFDGGDANLYRYVGNNPVNGIDPRGLTWKSNLSFFWDWALGQGSNNRFYGPNFVETQEMLNSPGGSALRDAFYAGGCRSISGNFAYGSGDAAWDTIVNPSSADLSGTGAQVGGFAGASAINNGDGTVTFTILNTAGTKSFFYHRVPDRSGSTGPMRNIFQTFQWTERINESECRCNR